MKTSELAGVSLDFWVAKARGISTVQIDSTGSRVLIESAQGNGLVFHEPSHDWAIAGPIIRNEKISLLFMPSSESGLGEQWRASTSHADAVTFVDSSPVVAAMRAYVASVFGDEVPDDPRIKADRKRNS